MASKRLLQAIAVTSELCGRVFSDASARVFADDLSGFDEDAVLHALAKCRKEVKGLLSLQDVISRIDDGRPGVEEAWAMLPQDDDGSVVWTAEMASAWGIALPLLNDGDRIAARMAFKEAYTRLLTQARDERLPVRWTPSFGGDKLGRQQAIIDAVRHNRLGMNAAVGLLPPDQAEGLLLSLGVKNHPLLAGPSKEGKAKARALLANLKMKKITDDDTKED